MKNTITEKDIPVKPAHVNSFINSKVVFMNKDECSIFSSKLANMSEPLFAVSEGDGRFIYSFSKIFESINTEITKLKDRRMNLIFYTIMGFFVWVGLIAYSVHTGGQPQLRLVAAASLIFFLWSLYELAVTRFKKFICSLEDKKTYVISESQDYLKQLKEEAQKPVLII